MTAINKYKEREPDWPCVHNESIGEVLELRNGSRSFLREFERITCEPTAFIKEWKNQPIIMKVGNIVSTNFHLKSDFKEICQIRCFVFNFL